MRWWRSSSLHDNATKATYSTNTTRAVALLKSMTSEEPRAGRRLQDRLSDTRLEWGVRPDARGGKPPRRADDLRRGAGRSDGSYDEADVGERRQPASAVITDYYAQRAQRLPLPLQKLEVIGVLFFRALGLAFGLPLPSREIHQELVDGTLGIQWGRLRGRRHGRRRG